MLFRVFRFTNKIVSRNRKQIIFDMEKWMYLILAIVAGVFSTLPLSAQKTFIGGNGGLTF
jgi:hypothetical protein